MKTILFSRRSFSKFVDSMNIEGEQIKEVVVKAKIATGTHVNIPVNPSDLMWQLDKGVEFVGIIHEGTLFLESG